MAAAIAARPARLLARALSGALALVALTASPAAADAAGPSDFRSEVTQITPEAEGVTAEILGGDSFLELRVDEGHEVIVEGYGGEPYLRFREDGTVERNRMSTATYVNDDRKGGGDIPPEVQEADERTEPVWEEVGSGGTYAWHDHRVHWMEDASPSVERGDRVPGAYDPWRVPIHVDGSEVEVQGILTYEEATSPLPFVALPVVAGGALALLARGRSLRVPAAALVIVSLAALLVGRADYASGPGGNPLLWALPAVALVAALGGLAGRATGAVVGVLASVATATAWALLRIDVFTKPVLPTTLPFSVDRAATAVAVGVALAAAVLAVTSGQLAFAPLEDDEPPTGSAS